MNKCFFLDRDGVINVEVDYLSDPAKTRLEVGSAEAIRRLNDHGFLVVVVTNQAGVARGLYPESNIELVHNKLRELVAAESGGRIDDFRYCPHHPEFTGRCDCRKPAPGMLLAARDRFDIDLAQSIMVGDRLSDLEAGRAAGCGASLLVLTGYGRNTLAHHPELADCAYSNLLEAVNASLATTTLPSR